MPATNKGEATEKILRWTIWRLSAKFPADKLCLQTRQSINLIEEGCARPIIINKNFKLGHLKSKAEQTLAQCVF